MTENQQTKIGDELHCQRCNRVWNQGRKYPPKTCRWCGSPDWNKPRTKAATVQRIPKLIENSESEDFFQGVRVLHKNGKYGTILSPSYPPGSTTLVTMIIDHGKIMKKVPIDKLKIVQEVSK